MRSRIVVDVGGTRSRFAISDRPGVLRDLRIYLTGERQSFAEALGAYLAEVEGRPTQAWCAGIAIAAAGPVDQGVVQLTNAPWLISQAEIAGQFGVPVRLVNDLEAVGLLLPHVQTGDVTPVGGVTQASLAGSRIAVNVGTGFGAATAVRGSGGSWTVVAGEAGHMVLAPTSPEEAALLGWGKTVEQYLSGAGILRLHAARLGQAAPDHDTLPRTAGSVIRDAPHDPRAAHTVQHISRLLGRIAGDLVLATASWEGAFLCGGVVRAWLGVADVAAFRAAFEDKGPMAGRMARVPTFGLSVPEPALLGLSHAAFLPS